MQHALNVVRPWELWKFDKEEQRPADQQTSIWDRAEAEPGVSKLLRWGRADSPRSVAGHKPREPVTSLNSLTLTGTRIWLLSGQHDNLHLCLTHHTIADSSALITMKVYILGTSQFWLFYLKILLIFQAVSTGKMDPHKYLKFNLPISRWRPQCPKFPGCSSAVQS